MNELKTSEVLSNPVQAVDSVVSPENSNLEFSEKKSFISLTFVLFGLLMITLACVAYLWYTGRFEKQTTESIAINTVAPTPTPTPIILIPDDGIKGNYVVSQSKDTVGPRIAKVTFDPLDVKMGETLKITVTTQSNMPVLSVDGILVSDHTSGDFSFSNTTTNGSAENTWTTSVVVDDSVMYKYILNLSAKSSEGTSMVTVAPRSSL